MNLSSVVTAYLAEKMVEHKSLACIRVTSEGHCISAEGALAKYGLANLEKGSALCDYFPFLDPYWPLSTHADALLQVHLDPDLIADIHIIPNRPISQFAPQSLLKGQRGGQPEEGWLLLLDTTRETLKQQQLQQQGNELSLIRYQQKRDRSQQQIAQIAQIAQQIVPPSVQPSVPSSVPPTVPSSVPSSAQPTVPSSVPSSAQPLVPPTVPPSSHRANQPKQAVKRPTERLTSITQQGNILSRATSLSSFRPPQMTINQEDSALLSNILSSLNLLILECQDPASHQLHVVGQPPSWAVDGLDCFNRASAVSSTEASSSSVFSIIPAEKFSPFLDNFLYDAQTCWQENTAQIIHSGAWTEVDKSGKELNLEAVALSLEDRNIVLVERLDTDSSEKFQWLQRARQEQLNFIAERKERENQISSIASYDSLTGLPNRTLFLSELETLFETSDRTHSNQFALVVLNLDRFQLINNSIGSEVGDQVLVAVAARMRACLRQFDIPVRFGSDEFGLLLGQIDSEDAAIAITQKLLESINQPFIINGTKTYFTASAGIALSARWYRHSRDLLRDASLAMQEAKRGWRGHYVVFKRDMRARAFELWSLESALDTVVEKGELALLYQPIVSLRSNRVEGFEALIRWNHPQKGQISPAKFIPLAEESGRILDIDNWVIHKACQTLRQWQQQTGSSAYLNINISPQHFERSGLFEAVRSAMQQANIPPDSICLEITESCLLADTQTVISTLNRLKELGVQVAIDDFGTGYASLGYLQDLPLDKLKIDGYFIEMMNSSGSEIVNTVVELAHRLNFNVTAERVETVEQYQMLRQLGCDMGQGYLFSEPLPPEEARSFIDAQVVIA